MVTSIPKKLCGSQTRTIRNAALAAAAVFGLSACTNSDTERLPRVDKLLAEQTGQDGRACVRVNDIRGYAVDGRLININAGRDYYVATTLYQCNDLQMAPRALFDARRFPKACGGSSYIVTRNARCPIQQIFEFEDREQAFEAVKLAKQSLADLKAQAKQD